MRACGGARCADQNSPQQQQPQVACTTTLVQAFPFGTRVLVVALPVQPGSTALPALPPPCALRRQMEHEGCSWLAVVAFDPATSTPQQAAAGVDYKDACSLLR